MSEYLTIDDFKLRSVIPPEYVDAVESVTPGFFSTQSKQVSAWIDARLRKRYDAPFGEVPDAVKAWCTRILTVTVWLRKGVDPQDPQFAVIVEDKKTAESEVKEAADSAVGLFDLPLRDSEKTSGISQGGPRVYSEASPYVWTDGQGAAGRGEDRNRGGTRA